MVFPLSPASNANIEKLVISLPKTGNFRIMDVRENMKVSELRHNFQSTTQEAIEGHPPGNRRLQLQVDMRNTVQELSDKLCFELGIAEFQSFSLMRHTGSMSAKAGEFHHDLPEYSGEGINEFEIEWLDPKKTLEQQNVDNTDDTLFLWKKFPSQDHGQRDIEAQVQSDAFYENWKRDIINGAHPVTVSNAIKLAALLCQSMGLGLNGAKIKDPEDLLPKEYQKVRGMKQKIRQAAEHTGSNSIENAKLLFAQACQSLPTYGYQMSQAELYLDSKKTSFGWIGISPQEVIWLDGKSKDVQLRVHFSDVEFFRDYTTTRFYMKTKSASLSLTVTDSSEFVEETRKLYERWRRIDRIKHVIMIDTIRKPQLVFKDRLPTRPVDPDIRIQSPELYDILRAANALDFYPTLVAHNYDTLTLKVNGAEGMASYGIRSKWIRSAITRVVRTDPRYDMNINPHFGAESETAMQVIDTQPSRPQPSAPPMPFPDTSVSIARVHKYCCICQNDVSSMIFLPCGHACTCEACSSHVSLCPVCRAFVEKRMKLCFMGDGE